MKKILISYGNEPFYKWLDLLEQSAYNIGKVDKVIKYTREWLETTDFYKKNHYILSNARGNGMWIWKPFIILETFKHIEDGDLVLYSDARLVVIDNLNPLFQVVQSDPNGGKIIFKLPVVGVPHHKAKTWTKRDCFVLMGCDEEKYWNLDMGNGAVSVWKKTPENEEFLKEWLKYLRDPRIVTDDNNMCGRPNFLEFRDHRHDQSVLSLLAAKYNLTLYRDPTQFGESEKELFANSSYPQLFNHHRGNLTT